MLQDKSEKTATKFAYLIKRQTLAWVVTNEECNCSNFQNMQEHHYKLPIEECNCSNFQNMQEHHYKLPIVFVGI